ncbi:alkaline D-peptidase [Pseudonocardia sp. MH-G8]|nr:alkaline D-peptidase [Pseudonocardia sp. MH-G8]
MQAGLDRLVETRAASAALLRIEEGEHEWSASAGPQEPSSTVPASASSRFRIGSVTKTFVATVVLQLVDEGRLALDDPIARHLPGLVPGGDGITVRQVLDHTSGIYDYAHERDRSTNRWRGEARFRTYQPQELLDAAFATPPYFPPGQGWHYSNTNYVLAGLLVERLTGRPYGTAIADRILRPLRLSHTTVPGSDPHLPEPHVRAVTAVDGIEVDATGMNPSLDWAAGEMISTTSDLNRFLAALLGGELIGPAALAAMRDTVETGQGFRYGLGLQEFALPCGVTLVGHSGELLGYTTYAMSTDSGRRLTLSYNPSGRTDGAESTAETLVGLFSSAFCPPSQTR